MSNTPDDQTPKPNDTNTPKSGLGDHIHILRDIGDSGEFGGFKGDYDFDLKLIFKRAYSLSTQNNWILVLALACIWAITFAIYLLFIDAFGITDVSLLITQETPLSPGQQILIELTLTFALAPLWTGLTMLAINTQRNRTLPVLSMFKYFKILPAVALASVCIDILFKFGFAFLIIPGFYVFIATTFTLPLIADMKMTPLKAITCSMKMSNIYIFKMVQLYLVFLTMLIVVFISFGFAYLWIGPFYFNVKAVLYQDLFCKQHNSDDDNADGGIFNA